jgi:hypothetical protein
MATKKFLREPKEKTTEPSADEVGGGMKRGGHAHKKHMAMGGMNPMGAIAPRRSMAMAPALLRRKSGGEVESKAEERREERRISKVEKELHHHEAMKAKKAHHGLKMGGKAAAAKDNTPGGLLGGLSATRPDRKKTSGGIELTGYKHGGKAHHISGHPTGTHKHHMAMAKHHAAKHAEGGSAHHKKMHEHHKHEAKMCKGGSYKNGGMLGKELDSFETKTTLKPKINVQDKVVDGSHNKKLGHKTGKVRDTVAGEGEGGYKRGGKAHYAKGGTVSQGVAKRYVNDMQDGEHRAVKGKKTGDLELSKFKKGGHVKHKAHGGHVAHHTTHGHGDHGHTHMHQHASKHAHGHDKIDGHPMKKGGHAKHHMKKGGKCNY